MISEIIRKWMRFSLGLLSSTQGIETLQEDEISIGNQIREKFKEFIISFNPPKSDLNFIFFSRTFFISKQSTNSLNIINL